MTGGRTASGTGFHGVYPILYSLFDREDRLDPVAMRRQVDGCLAAGAHGIAILGIASEMNKLSGSERVAFLEIVAEALADRRPLAATVPEASVSAQIEFARRAAQAARPG